MKNSQSLLRQADSLISRTMWAANARIATLSCCLWAVYSTYLFHRGERRARALMHDAAASARQESGRVRL